MNARDDARRKAEFMVTVGGGKAIVWQDKDKDGRWRSYTVYNNQPLIWDWTKRTESKWTKVLGYLFCWYSWIRSRLPCGTMVEDEE